MNKYIVFTLLLMKTFSANAIVADFKNRTVINLCPEKFVSHEIITDKTGFLEYEKFLFDKPSGFSETFNLNIYGVLVRVDDKSNIDSNKAVSNFFLKAFDTKENDMKWVNVDILTNNPFLKESEIVLRVKSKICNI